MNIRLPAPVAAALTFLLLVLLLAAFVYGLLVQRFQWFPAQFVSEVEQAIIQSVDTGADGLAWYYQRTDKESAVWQAEGFGSQHLNLMTAMGADDRIKVTVFDQAGTVVNDLDVDWFDIWGDATHLPASDVPKSRPGTHIHGIVMLPDGDVVFNFEQLGLVRMDSCGELVWKLPYRTHHSVYLDAAGDLWVSGQITHEAELPAYPNHRPPFREPIVLQISPAGEIRREISVFDVFVQNDLRAYLHLVTPNNRSTLVTGDTLHLNDVEVFPGSAEPGLFQRGDIMISLRNISTVLVFDPETLEIRLRLTGNFTRQHDPDFIDGYRVSVFDNNHVGPESFGQQSRILLLDARTEASDSTYFEGSAANPFYTDIMGKNQWLDDGGLLITDSRNGRAFQLDAQRDMVWEYNNIVAPGVVGLVEEVQRLPAAYSKLFATPQAERCTVSL